MKFSAYLAGLRRLYASRDVDLKLARPATAAALGRMKSTYGYALPAELRNAYRTSDGIPAEKPVFARPGYLTSYTFLSTASALRHREIMRKRAPTYRDYVEKEPRDPRIAPGWYSDGWLPFADFGGGSLLLIVDFSPAARGTPGQIIAFTHDPDEMSYVARSFEPFLSASLKAARGDPDEFLGLF
jgi:cell wall assembly regulator SMI1